MAQRVGAAGVGAEEPAQEWTPGKWGHRPPPAPTTAGTSTSRAPWERSLLPVPVIGLGAQEEENTGARLLLVRDIGGGGGRRSKKVPTEGTGSERGKEAGPGNETYVSDVKRILADDKGREGRNPETSRACGVEGLGLVWRETFRDRKPTPRTVYAAQASPLQGRTAAAGVDVGATNHQPITENTGPCLVWLSGLEPRQVRDRLRV